MLSISRRQKKKKKKKFITIKIIYNIQLQINYNKSYFLYLYGKQPTKIVVKTSLVSWLVAWLREQLQIRKEWAPKHSYYLIRLPDKPKSRTRYLLTTGFLYRVIKFV